MRTDAKRPGQQGFGISTAEEFGLPFGGMKQIDVAFAAWQQQRGIVSRSRKEMAASWYRQHKVSKPVAPKLTPEQISEQRKESWRLFFERMTPEQREAWSQAKRRKLPEAERIERKRERDRKARRAWKAKQKLKRAAAKEITNER